MASAWWSRSDGQNSLQHYYYSAVMYAVIQYFISIGYSF